MRNVFSMLTFLKMSQTGLKYSTNLTIESVYGVFWTRFLGGMMVGADKSTELWRHPLIFFFENF